MDLSILDKLREPCGMENPAGENLEYDPSFLEMIRLSERQSEQQFGNTIREARDPDWNRLFQSTFEVAQRTRDLRVAVRMLESLAHLATWDGLAHGMELLEQWTCTLWDSVHPQLEPEDDLDPTARISTLSHLVSDDCLLKTISRLPLASHRTLGTISLHDYKILFQSSDESAPSKLTRADAEAIFHEMDAEEFRKNFKCIQRTQASFQSLSRFLGAKLGTALWSGDRLQGMLEQVDRILQKHQPIPMQNSFEPVADDCQASDNANFTSASLPQAELDTVVPPGEVEPAVTKTITRIASRSEATAAIDSICSYFEINEPASPVPLLLQRAKRLIPMSFVEIMHELAASNANQLLQNLAGAESNRN